MNEAGDRWFEFARQDLQMAELALQEGIYNQYKVGLSEATQRFFNKHFK
jgi:hypothetical protein